MTITIQTDAHSLLLDRTQHGLLMEPPSNPLVVDGDGTSVNNVEDRTGNPAVLISGNENTFTNESGATLTGTGVNANVFNIEAAEAALEVTGADNPVENNEGAVIRGAVGILSSGGNTSILNEGEIRASDPGIPSHDDSIGVVLAAGSSIENMGLVRAEARDVATAIRADSQSTVLNEGTIEAVGRSVFGITASTGASIENGGLVDITSSENAVGLSVNGPGGGANNSGTIRVHLDGQPGVPFGGNAFGMTAFDGLLSNSGTIEMTATGGDTAFGIQVTTAEMENEGTISVSTTQAERSIGVRLNASSGSNDMTITASAADAEAIGVTALDKSSFQNGGEIVATGQKATGVRLTEDSILTNAGSVSASGSNTSGVVVENSASVVNEGDILAESSGEPSVGIAFESSFGNPTAVKSVVNKGTISAGIAIADRGASTSSLDVLSIENEGLIDGMLMLGNGRDLVFNSGTVNGNVSLGDGNDVYADEGGGQTFGTIDGGAGDDILIGGEGVNLLIGGAGFDVLTGGEGDDIFRFDSDGGDDTIVDFAAGDSGGDIVDLSEFGRNLTFSDVLSVASEVEGFPGRVDTVLTFDAETTLTFQGVRLAEINEADFVF